MILSAGNVFQPCIIFWKPCTSFVRPCSVCVFVSRAASFHELRLAPMAQYSAISLSLSLSLSHPLSLSLSIALGGEVTEPRRGCVPMLSAIFLSLSLFLFCLSRSLSLARSVLFLSLSLSRFLSLFLSVTRSARSQYGGRRVTEPRRGCVPVQSASAKSAREDTRRTTTPCNDMCSKLARMCCPS